MKNSRIEHLRHISRKLIRELGLLQLNKRSSVEPPQYWHALIEISKNPGITTSMLGHLLLVSTSTISRLVKVFMKKELVRCEQGLDKRERYLYITEKGLSDLEKINEYSVKKTKSAFEFLTEQEQEKIISGITLYVDALEESRQFRENIKVLVLSASRVIRKQVIAMIENIQKNEFGIPVTNDINIGILKAEQEYSYNKTQNFWYAVNDDGTIIGSIGLKKVDNATGELKKLFVSEKYRGSGLAQKLLYTLLMAAEKHNFKFLYLGSAGELESAHAFYQKSGFNKIAKSKLPKNFELCKFDAQFFKGDIQQLKEKIEILID